MGDMADVESDEFDVALTAAATPHGWFARNSAELNQASAKPWNPWTDDGNDDDDDTDTPTCPTCGQPTGNTAYRTFVPPAVFAELLDWLDAADEDLPQLRAAAERVRRPDRPGRRPGPPR